MAVTACVLIQAKVGTTASVGEAIRELQAVEGITRTFTCLVVNL